jgi:vacuolar-type H+-ATPase subunit E/Vma4
MHSAFESIRREIKNYTKKAEYKKSLENMVNFAKSQLGQDVIISCRDADAQVIKDLNVTVGPPIDTVGGITATDKDGTRELDLTFEELLENNEDELKNYLYEKMV